MTSRLARCAHCGSSMELPESLEDVSEFAPLSGLYCEDGLAELISDWHDDPACSCAACTRVCVLSERELRQREAALRMGGGAWLEEES